jgi:uncharacterized membrane protein
MTTPLIMLAILAVPFLMVTALAAAGGPRWDASRAAVYGLAAVFLFAATGHFAQTEAMVQMLPSWVPLRGLLVYATGVLEIAIAVGLVIPALRKAAGYAAAAVLVLFFPANVYAAFTHAPMGGHAWGPVYFLIRGPLQVVLIAWVYCFVLRPVAARPEPAMANQR